MLHESPSEQVAHSERQGLHCLGEAVGYSPSGQASHVLGVLLLHMILGYGQSPLEIHPALHPLYSSTQTGYPGEHFDASLQRHTFITQTKLHVGLLFDIVIQCVSSLQVQTPDAVQ